MINDELAKALATATYYYGRYDDNTPDVGFPLSLETKVNYILIVAEVVNTTENIQRVVDVYKQRWG